MDDQYDIRPRGSSGTWMPKSPSVANTLGLTELGKESENAIVMNAIDKDIYHDLTQQFDAMDENLTAGLQEYAPFELLSEDIFNSLFKHKPQLRESDEVKPFSKLNQAIMEGLMEDEQFGDLRKYTQFDMIGSAMGTEALQAKAMERILHYKEQYKQSKLSGQKLDGADEGELINNLNQLKTLQDEIASLEDLKASHGLTAAQAARLMELQKQERQIDEDITQADDVQENLKNNLSQAMASGAKEIFVEAQELRKTVDSWGIGGGDHSRSISLKERKQAIDRIRRSGRLKKLTDLIGRFRSMVVRKKKRPIPDGHNIKSVTLGNKLEDTIPSELMLLGIPETELLFMSKYMEKQLLVYKKEHYETMGRGPVVVMHDKSGSMGGHKDDWATALTLATLEIAQKEKRPFAYVPYDDYVLATKDIQPGELNPQDVLDIAEMNPSGGTNFERPLRHAIKVLCDSRYNKADLLFITDGDCGVSDLFLEKFHATKLNRKFYVTTVVLNIGGGGSDATVRLFSDYVTKISNIAELNDENADKIFNMIDDKGKYGKSQLQNNSTVAKIIADVKKKMEAGQEVGFTDDELTKGVIDPSITGQPPDDDEELY